MIKKVISNKTRDREAERKLNNHITSYKKLINDLSKKVELISTNGLKNKIRKMNIVFLMMQNIFPKKMDHKIIQCFNQVLNISNQVRTIGFSRENLRICQMKTLNLLLHQKTVLI